MKKIFFLAAIIVALLTAGCSTKSKFDLKLTLTPREPNSVITKNDMNKAAEVSGNRLINFFSIPKENIQSEISGNKIVLTISNADTGKIGLIRNVLSGYHKLEFLETYDYGEVKENLLRVNLKLRDMETPVKGEKKSEMNPLFDILHPLMKSNMEQSHSCLIGLVNVKDTSRINEYFRMDQIKALLPGDLRFYWSANPYRYDSSRSFYELHAIKVNAPGKEGPVNGSSIISARTIIGRDSSNVKIDLSMDSAGTKTWARVTRENIGRCIAVVFDGYVRSYPRVQVEISGGNTEITGDFAVRDADFLVNILKSGDLPFELRVEKALIIRR